MEATYCVHELEKARRTVMRLVLIGPGSSHGIVLDSQPVITALDEGGRALATQQLVLGDRITHINPRLYHGCGLPSDRALHSSAEVTCQLEALQPDAEARVWVKRAVSAVATSRKPAGGLFGITFVTIAGAMHHAYLRRLCRPKGVHRD